MVVIAQLFLVRFIKWEKFFVPFIWRPAGKRSGLFIHGVPVAGNDAAAFGIQPLDQKVDLASQHVSKDLVLALGKFSVIMGFIHCQVDHHLAGKDN